MKLFPVLLESCRKLGKKWFDCTHKIIAFEDPVLARWTNCALKIKCTQMSKRHPTPYNKLLKGFYAFIAYCLIELSMYGWLVDDLKRVKMLKILVI